MRGREPPIERSQKEKRKVGVEEAGDAAAGVEGRRFLIGDAGEAQRLEPEAPAVARE